MTMLGAVGVFYAMIEVFFRLMVRPNSFQALGKRETSCCKPFSVWDVTKTCNIEELVM